MKNRKIDKNHVWLDHGGSWSSGTVEVNERINWMSKGFENEMRNGIYMRVDEQLRNLCIEVWATFTRWMTSCDKMGHYSHDHNFWRER